MSISCERSKPRNIHSIRNSRGDSTALREGGQWRNHGQHAGQQRFPM
jgi:hypothetical protein